MLHLLLVAAVSGSASQDALSSLVDRIDAHYDSVRDFEADFTQRYERRLLRRTVEEKGKVSVKKPGRMRWEYRTPENKLFVTDGSKTYFYLPAENQVMVSQKPQGAMGMEEGSPFELLAGRGRLSDSFLPALSDEPATRGGTVIRLEPARPREEFELVELEVEPATGRALRVVLIDSASNRTEFLFDDVRENVGLPESLFRFAIPSGVEVVVQQSDKPSGAP
jgi:outer membrane lipoprotein carrier protein